LNLQKKLIRPLALWFAVLRYFAKILRYIGIPWCAAIQVKILNIIGCGPAGGLQQVLSKMAAILAAIFG